ncbi:hypothetical protein CUMW_001960 [Citrus unshiu]|nr:hypothetical protein CUMW_001960 [Citrus unshiu]
MESAESWKLERVPSVYWLTLVMPRSEVQFRIHVGFSQQMWTRDRQWAQVVQVEMVRSESSLSGIGSWGARIAYGAQAKLKTERFPKRREKNRSANSPVVFSFAAAAGFLQPPSQLFRLLF